tara:strand:- start:555 stop:1175 length:621 start_codon:yes stop_codon:yes gene_type:complete
MAINDGLAVTCEDLQDVGGTRLIAIRSWATGDVALYDNSDHTITSITDVGGVDADWGVYESRIESSSLSVTGTGEGKDFQTYECVVSFFLPGLSTEKFNRLQEMRDKCLMVLVIDNNDAKTSGTAPSATFAKNKVIGISEEFNNVDDQVRNQTYAKLTGVEGGTGSAFSDEIGVTVTITATQFEIPRTYKTGTVTLGATGLTLITT